MKAFAAVEFDSAGVLLCLFHRLGIAVAAGLSVAILRVLLCLPRRLPHSGPDDCVDTRSALQGSVASLVARRCNDRSLALLVKLGICLQAVWGSVLGFDRVFAVLLQSVGTSGGCMCK